MIFDWNLYLQLAEELISHQKTGDLREAYLRSAISRSYYGVFCIARNFLVNKGTTIPKVDTHKFVRDTYWKSPNREEKKIGKSLHNLWLDRKDADYENNAHIDVNRAKTAHQMASQIMDNLRKIGAHSDRNRSLSINKTGTHDLGQE